DIELFDDITPITVANLLNYVNDGDYEGTFFHRVLDGFVVQGGGYAFDGPENSFFAGAHRKSRLMIQL
ncbi:MAG: peptidylprolyl isomerase, partial [Gammaproteobacteria bacterium]